MKKISAICGSGLSALAMIGALAGNAFSGVSGAGIDFKATTSAGASCIATFSSAGIINNCTATHTVATTMPVEVGDPFTTYDASFTVYGKSTSCRALVTDTHGDTLLLGPLDSASGSLPSWQTLDSGGLFVPFGGALMVRCGLEPSGVIGQVRVQ